MTVIVTRLVLARRTCVSKDVFQRSYKLGSRRWRDTCPQLLQVHPRSCRDEFGEVGEERG